MKYTSLLFLLSLILVIVSCTNKEQPKKSADMSYYLTAKASVNLLYSPDAHIFTTFFSKTAIHPYGGSITIDGKQYIIEVTNIEYDTDGYESFNFNLPLEKNGVSEDSSDVFVKQYRAKLANAKSLIFDLKGKTGNQVYTITQENILKYKKVYDWFNVY